MKKIIYLFLLVYNTIVFSQTFDIGNLKYEVISGTSSPEVKVKQYLSTTLGGSVTIPESVIDDGTTYTVTKISSGVFNNFKLTSVTMPNTIQEIEQQAFANNNYTELNLSTGLKIIRPRAFENNVNLSSITIPASVSFMDTDVFKGSSSITSVTYNATNPSVYSSGIFDDKSKIDLNIPDGSEAIYNTRGWTDFKTISLFIPTFDIGNLKYEVISGTSSPEVKVKQYLSTTLGGSVTIPESVIDDGTTYTVTKISSGVFNNFKLTSVTMPNTIQEIEQQAFANNNYTELSLSTGLKIIRPRAFENNVNLSSITIPASVSFMDTDVFKGSSSITSVTYNATNPSVYSSGIFDDKSKIDLNIPDGSEAIYNTRGWTDFKSTTLKYEGVVSANDLDINIDNNTIFVSSKLFKIVGINIYNLIGQKLAGSNNSFIEINGLTNAVYLLQIVTNQGVVTKKIVK